VSGWRRTLLGDELELAYGKALPAIARQSGEYEVFGSNGSVGTHDKSLVDGPGIVVGRKGSVGAVKFSPKAFWPIDTTYYVVNRNNNSWRYIYYLLLSSRLTELNSHSAVPGLNRDSVYSIVVNVPPRSEQDDIARVLDCTDAAVHFEAAVLTHVQRVKDATMRQLFTRGLRNEPQVETEIGFMPASWKMERLGTHYSVVSGGTPSRGEPAFWSGGDIPWVKTTEVNYCVIQQTEECITPQGLTNSAAKLLPAGTLLMAMYGQGVTRGKVAILGIEAACNQACAAMTPLSEALLPRYLYHFLSWRYEAIRSLAHGGQQQNLNLDIVRDLPVAYPMRIDEQRYLVSVLDALDGKIALHRQKRALLEQIFTILLDRLLSGELRIDDLALPSLPATHEELQDVVA
jgi:type I restriction enzyme, S subunit